MGSLYTAPTISLQPPPHELSRRVGTPSTILAYHDLNLDLDCTA